MAFVLTYDSLTQAVQDYLQRTNSTFIVDIPLFIMFGQRRVCRDLKILGFRNVITEDLIPQAQNLVKPLDWLSTSSFNIGVGVGSNTRVQILQRSYEYCRIYWPNPFLYAQPKYFSDYLESPVAYTTFLIVPTPDIAYPYELIYYQIPTLIDADNQTNFMTANYPDILTYATLLETASYLRDDERVGVWLKYYDTAKAALGNEDIKRIYDGYSKRGG